MTAILSLLVVIIVSILVVRVATVALVLTGLSAPLARFQARSAFTGAGFTTSESEQVVNHPVRRRIIMLLMLLGNAGIVTAVSSLMLSMLGTEAEASRYDNLGFRLTFLAAGLAVLWMIASSQWVDRLLGRIIRTLLLKYTRLELRDYAGLLHLSGGYVVAELKVTEEDWMSGRSLAELRLMDEGILILGIERIHGGYCGAPRGDTLVEPDDTLLLYGQSDTINNLDRRDRWKGNVEHFKAVSDQARRNRDEQETLAESEATIEP